MVLHCATCPNGDLGVSAKQSTIRFWFYSWCSSMADPQVSMAHMDINVDTFDQKSSALKVWRVPQE